MTIKNRDVRLRFIIDYQADTRLPEGSTEVVEKMLKFNLLNTLGAVSSELEGQFFNQQYQIKEVPVDDR